MKQTIYAIEDDAAIQELFIYSLENEFDCRCFSDGASFFDALASGLPDLVLLDVMLPGNNAQNALLAGRPGGPENNGFTILSQLKNDKTTAHIPVIMVSAKGEEVSKVKGLNMGADDYIAKPFGVLEFIARIKANLRKSGVGADGNIEYKNITVDNSKHCIIVNGCPIQTTLKEYNLLRLLCENAEKVQERENIFNEVWGDSFIGETRTLDFHIKELRKKLTENGSEAKIQTIRGVGYILT